jgi:hypothetical protein
MNRLSMLIIILISALFALSACNEGKNNTLTPTKGNGGAKATGPNGAQKTKPTDAELKRKNLMRGIGQADQIFKQVLSKGLNSSAPKSLFEGIFGRLKKHGFGLKKDLKAFSTECPRYSTLLSQVGTLATERTYYTIKDVDCPQSKTVNPKEITALEIEIIKNTYSITASPDRWIGALGTFYLLNQIQCSLQIEDNGKLTDLSCKNLGTGLEDDLFAVFDVFEYHVKNPNMVEISTTNYRNDRTKVCGNSPCLSIKVPLTGTIKIIEVIPDELDTNPLNPATPKGTTAVDPLAPKENLSGQNQNSNQNQAPNQNQSPSQNQGQSSGQNQGSGENAPGVQEPGLDGQDIGNLSNH